MKTLTKHLKITEIHANVRNRIATASTCGPWSSIVMAESFGVEIQDDFSKELGEIDMKRSWRALLLREVCKGDGADITR